MRHSSDLQIPSKILVSYPLPEETNPPGLAQHQAPIIVQLTSSATSVQIKQYPMTLKRLFPMLYAIMIFCVWTHSRSEQKQIFTFV